MNQTTMTKTTKTLKMNVLATIFVVGSAIFVVVVGVSSSLESEEESDDELEETARLLRFLILFLCVGGFVAAGGICAREKRTEFT
jgi:hypothetical protein